MNKTFFFTLFSLFLLAGKSTALDSREIFQQHESSVFQIRVIHKETGKKSSLGSGFLVHDGTQLATNYHVVADYIRKPEIYQLRYLAMDGSEGPLNLTDIDAVHDLALVSATESLGQAVENALPPAKGETIYAMGIPLDLGLTVAVGTNGGVLNQTDDSRILFSGSLNSGMSGGPTFNQSGQVIGINVSTARNDISFIVPVRYLDKLLSKAAGRQFQPLTDFNKAVDRQIHAYQVTYLAGILEHSWPTTSIRKMQVPEKISDTVRCWDDSPTVKPEHLYRRLSIRCQNENDIYLSERLEVGKIVYEYLWLESTKLDNIRFHRLYQNLNNSQFSSRANKEDVGNFSCRNWFVSIGRQTLKTSLCQRHYLEHPQLSDVLFTAALVGLEQQGFIFNLDLSGTDYTSAVRLIGKFLEAMKWKS